MQRDSKPTSAIKEENNELISAETQKDGKKKEDSNEISEELLFVKQQYEAIYTNMESIEKSFRENRQRRKVYLNPKIFFVGEYSTFPGLDYREELKLAATEELRIINHRRKLRLDEIALKKAEQVKLLEASLEEAKVKFRKTDLLLNYGPQFLYHFFSSFGNPIQIEQIDTGKILVFSDNSICELWTYEKVEGVGIQPKLQDYTKLPIKEMCAITLVKLSCHMETSEQQEETEDAAQVGSKQDLNESSPTKKVSFQKNVAPTLDILGQKAAAGAVGLAADGEKKPQADTNEAVEVSHLRKTYIALYFCGLADGHGLLIDVIVSEAEDGSGNQWSISYETHQKKRLSQYPISLCCYAKYEDSICVLARDPPDHQGSQIIALDVEKLDVVWRCSTSVLERKALKSPSGNTGKTFRESGRSPSFSSLSRRKSMILPLGFDARTPKEEVLITAMCPDNIMGCLLVALKGGTIFRLSYEKVLQTPSNIVVTKPALSRDPQGSPSTKPQKRRTEAGSNPSSGQNSAEKVVKEITFSLMLTLISKKKPKKPDSNPPSTGGGGNQPSPAKYGNVSKANTPGEGVTVAIDETLEVCDLMAIQNLCSHKPNVVVGCQDGTFRCISSSIVTMGKELLCYPEDTEKPVLYEDEPDRWCTQGEGIFMRVKTVLLTPKKQLILGYSSQGFFVVYDLNTKRRLLEIRVLGNRNTVGDSYLEKLEIIKHLLQHKQLWFQEEIEEWYQDKLQQTETLKPDSNQIFVIDESQGLLVLTSGNEWTLLSLQRLLSWMEQKEGPSVVKQEAAATDLKEPEEKEKEKDIVEEDIQLTEVFKEETAGLEKAFQSEMSPWAEQALPDVAS